MFAINTENLSPKIYVFKKALDLFIVYIKCGHEYKKIFEEESIEILKILVLITNIEAHQKIYNDI